MWLDSHNTKIIEPSLGLVSAVANDEMVAAQRLVVKVIPIRGIVIGLNRVANDNGMVAVADVDGAVAQVVIKRHTQRFLCIRRLEVRAAHVATHQRALDVDFVLVVGFVYLFAGAYQC